MLVPGFPRCYRRGSFGPLQPIRGDMEQKCHVSLLSIIAELFFFFVRHNIAFEVHHANTWSSSVQYNRARMKLSNQSEVPVYTISGSNTARPLPEWLARRRKRSLKNDPEYANRVELLQDFEFEEASQCVRVSEDGEWVMSTGELCHRTSTGPQLTRDCVFIQEPTSPRSILITYLNYRSHGPVTQ